MTSIGGWPAALVVGLIGALALPPGEASAGGTELEALALAALDQPETRTGGSLLGPSSSRATWFSLGGVRPFSGEAMALFSTGVVDTVPVPGTDLAAVGVDDDISGVNLSLTVPADARSLRFAFRVIAPEESLDDPDSALDHVRVEVTGDPQALDPWTLSDLQPGSLALQPDSDGLLDGTRYEGALLSEWLVAVVPVQPLSQIPVLFSVRDGGEDAGGDFVLLLDGVRFDPAIPEDVPPGVVPFIEDFGPRRLPEGVSSQIIIAGRELPADLGAALVDEDAVTVLELGASGVDWRSRERAILTVPGLEAGRFGLQLRWGDGASLTWPLGDDGIRIDTEAPSIERIRPDTAPPEGGGIAVIEGTGFHEISSVRVGTAEVTEVQTVSPERIELVLPPQEPGPHRVLVFGGGGSAELSGGVLYAAPEDGEEPSTPAPGGPTVASCALGGSTSGGALLFLLVLLVRRRR